jgi:hypothetical protein
VLAYGISRAGEHGWTDAIVLGAFAAAGPVETGLALLPFSAGLTPSTGPTSSSGAPVDT